MNLPKSFFGGCLKLRSRGYARSLDWGYSTEGFAARFRAEGAGEVLDVVSSASKVRRQLAPHLGSTS